MTIWAPQLTVNPDTPIYRRIADQLENDVVEGLLLPGSRLPTQRELARKLGCTVVTVTRAYAEAAARGLVESTVGRGSFVRRRSTGSSVVGEIDLATNVISAGAVTMSRDLAARLGVALGAPYGPPAGSERHRAAGAAWIAAARPDATTARTSVTTGAQQAILAAFAATTQPGDAVMTEDVTYHGVKSVASLLHVRLEPLVSDRHGITPESFGRACRRRLARVLYVTPSLQNPTGTVMPEKRRRELAEIASKYAITVIEDDVYGFLLPDPPRSLSSLLPDSSLFLTGLGKSVTPALRIGYLLAPEALLPRIHSALAASTLFPSALGAEIAATWIEDGTASRLVASKRAAIAQRANLARRILGKRAAVASEHSPHLWIELPDQWNGDTFADEALRRGVRVARASSFATGTVVPNAVRICIGAPTTAAELEQALEVLIALYDRNVVAREALAVV